MATKKKPIKKKAKKKVAKKKAAKKSIGGTKSKAKRRTSKEKKSAMHGNSFWMARSTHGRNPIFNTPDDLWDACVQYFTWIEENPLSEEKLFAFQGQITRTQISKIRAMTIGSLCIFLDICQNTWTNYKNKEGKTPEQKKLAKDYLRVTEQVESIIKSQKFQGAAADLLNANIIARDLGLKDNSEVTGAGGGPIEQVILNKKEYAAARKKMLKTDDC